MPGLASFMYLAPGASQQILVWSHHKRVHLTCRVKGERALGDGRLGVESERVRVVGEHVVAACEPSRMDGKETGKGALAARDYHGPRDRFCRPQRRFVRSAKKGPLSPHLWRISWDPDGQGHTEKRLAGLSRGHAVGVKHLLPGRARIHLRGGGAARSVFCWPIQEHYHPSARSHS